MGTKNVNTLLWITQKALADEMGIPVQNVHNWVRRGKIQYQKLPGSKIILVNKDTVSIDTQHHKRRSQK